MKGVGNMKSLFAALAICIAAGSYSTAAAATTQFIDGSTCRRTEPVRGLSEITCELGQTPPGFGYNAVVPMFYTSPNHIVGCFLWLTHPRFGSASPVPQGHDFHVIYFNPGIRTGVTLFYRWTHDFYAGYTGKFICQEQLFGGEDPNMTMSGVYTLRE
jgi:hypothetical protein